ncbi:MAG: LytTR family DNA-binding domain-containing protein [Akkermansiaceae bacterium]|nr:LytTR family DNA-binding domain-containing protein [Akkermansiaceae bacterium]
MLTALIVDDEPNARELMISLLAEHPEVRVLGTAASVAEAVALLRQHTPDLVFLDLDMPGGSGFDLIKHLPQLTRVILVTACAQSALLAYEAGAHDYLLKPFDRERLALALGRLALFSPKIRSSEEVSPENCLNLALSHRDKAGQLTRSRVEDILWIEAEQNYSRIVFQHQEREVVIHRKLAQWEKILPLSDFQRIGRSLIIQIPRIHVVRWSSREDTVVSFIDSSRELRLGRSAALRLRAVLKG